MTRIVEDVKLDFQDVQFVPKRFPSKATETSRADIDITRIYKFRHTEAPQYYGVPIIVANMDHTGTFEMAEALKVDALAVALHKFYTVDQLYEYFMTPGRNSRVFYTMGVRDNDIEKLHAVMARIPAGIKPMYLCIDVANGYAPTLLNIVKRIRDTYPWLCIMAGNVVTPDMVYDLIEGGADIVKIGIGSGSVCITRKLTGVGYPQFSAVIECADAAHGVGGLICSDGGVTSPGDIAKAFGAGADFVMAGGMFAGHDECAGERIYEAQAVARGLSEQSIHIREYRAVVTDPTSRQESQLPGKITKMKFYGMSSKEAMDKYYGGKADYRASEGKVVEVEYKGPVKATVEDILGGIRSTCMYTGAARLKDLPKVATFVKANRQLNDVFG
jgi:GMP reductase